MFFDSWNDLLRILVVGACAYAGLVLFLRVTGKRTLSKMNAFDFIVTVALGSTLASVLLTSTISLSEGLLAFALLCTLQYVVTWVSVRSPRFQALVKAEPSLLFYRGRFLQGRLRAERVTQEEILAAMRADGVARLEEVEAVVLETDGTFSIVPTSREEAADTLRYVEGTPLEQGET